MKYRFLAAAVLPVVLAGCVKPQLAEPLVMPRVPAPTTDLMQVNVLVSDTSDLAEGVTQHPTHKFAPNSSVVINVPEELFEHRSSSQAGKQEFKTAAFFNAAEQQIERELIRNGFHVLSRSKFEAKLRSLRDEAQCLDDIDRCRELNTTPEEKVMLRALKERFEAGNMPYETYLQRTNEVYENSKKGSVGQKREGNEKELTDISEVIRAAESGETRADYVLQINIFETDQKKNITENLLHIDSVRAYLRDNPGIAREFNNGNNLVTCETIQSHLNAKLVHVKTGEIAWIGEHSLNEYSAGVQSVGFEFGKKRYVSNGKKIQRFIRRNNTEEARIRRAKQEVSIPPFQYAESLIKPTVSSGRCGDLMAVDNETKMKLARQVAKELIRTIRVVH